MTRERWKKILVERCRIVSEHLDKEGIGAPVLWFDMTGFGFDLRTARSLDKLQPTIESIFTKWANVESAGFVMRGADDGRTLTVSFEVPTFEGFDDV